MPTSPHKIPELRREGFRQTDITPGGVAEGQKREPAARGGWASGAPTVRVAHAGFSRLTVDLSPLNAQGDTTVPEAVAWYPLASIRPHQFGDEVALVCATIDMLPTYHDDAGDTLGSGDSLPWGSSNGLAAAIVIGKNLGLAPGVWTAKPAYILGLQGAIAPFKGYDTTHPYGATESDSGPAPYLAYTQFPPGSFADAIPIPKRAYFPFSGTAARVAQSETLDVALVLDRKLLGSQGEIFGYAHCSLVLAVATPDSPFPH